MFCQMSDNVLTMRDGVLASFPGPRPAFRRLQYGKAGEGLVHFLTNPNSSRDSREDREFYQAKTVKTHSNNLVVLAHVQLKPFYRLSTRDVTHVRKCTRPSPALPYCKRRKAGRGPGNEANGVWCLYSLTRTKVVRFNHLLSIQHNLVSQYKGWSFP